MCDMITNDRQVTREAFFVPTKITYLLFGHSARRSENASSGLAVTKGHDLRAERYFGKGGMW